MNFYRIQPEKKNASLKGLLWGLFIFVMVSDWFFGTEFPVIWMVVPLLIWAAIQNQVRFYHICLMGMVACLLPGAQFLLTKMSLAEGLINLIFRLVIFGSVLWFSYHYLRVRAQAVELARSDLLTGVINQSAFMEMLQQEMDRARRKNWPLTLAYLDCDDFRKINEKQGHPAGDETLKTVATTLYSSVRSYDLVGRMGGDEFCLVFAETNSQQAKEIFKRIQTELRHCTNENHSSVTFSIGVVTFYEIPVDCKEAVTLADRVMYEVKHSGKNGISFQTEGSVLKDPISHDPFGSMENQA